MTALRLRRRRPPAVPALPCVVVCRWDLDKTYLRSEFDSLRQMVRTVFEKGTDKVDVPGVAELLKVLKAAGERHGRTVRAYFVSASPPQIGKAIRDKLALDGVPYDGIVFKNQLQHLRPGKLHNLREHVGYKLAELLRGRLAAPLESRELVFGDDWESDSIIYSLYADVLAGRLRPAALAPILHRLRVDPALARDILALAARAANGRETVDRIFINLERRTPPATFRLFGARLVPIFNYFQAAVVLAADGHLDADDVVRVGRDIAGRAGASARQLENSLDDLVRRGHLGAAAATTMAAPLRAAGLLPPGERVRWREALHALARRHRLPRPAGSAEVAPTTPLDYAAILDRQRPAGRRRGAAPGTKEAP